MNIYIGNLDFKVDEIEMIKMFALYGDVETVKLVRDKDTGRSKGFGFVEMPKDEDARRAIDHLNDKEIFGRRIKVNDANEHKSEGEDTRRRDPRGDSRRPPFNRDSRNTDRRYEPRDQSRYNPSDRPGGRFDRKPEDRPPSRFDRKPDDRPPSRYDRRPDDRPPSRFDRGTDNRPPSRYDRKPDDRPPRTDRGDVPRTPRPPYDSNRPRNYEDRPPRDRDRKDD